VSKAIETMEPDNTSPSTAALSPAEKTAPPTAAISLTPKAVEMAKKQLVKRGTPDAAIRLGLRGGGCSGFTYVIEFSEIGRASCRERV